MKKPKSAGVPSSRFVGSVIADVERRLRARTDRRKLPIAYDFPDCFRLLGNEHVLISTTFDHDLLWLLQEYPPSGAPRVVGAGLFRFRARPQRLLVELRAALRPDHQGRGLYPRILRALRVWYARPLRSDVNLSAANIKAWSKVGVFNTDTQAFHVNPKKSTPIPEQIALAWLATEGKIPYARTRHSRR